MWIIWTFHDAHFSEILSKNPLVDENSQMWWNLTSHWELIQCFNTRNYLPVIALAYLSAMNLRRFGDKWSTNIIEYTGETVTFDWSNIMTSLFYRWNFIDVKLNRSSEQPGSNFQWVAAQSEVFANRSEESNRKRSSTNDSNFGSQRPFHVANWQRLLTFR